MNRRNQKLPALQQQQQLEQTNLIQNQRDEPKYQLRRKLIPSSNIVNSQQQNHNKQQNFIENDLIQNKLQQWNINDNNNYQQQDIKKKSKRNDFQFNRKQSNLSSKNYNPNDLVSFFSKLFQRFIKEDDGRKLLLNRMQISKPIPINDALASFHNNKDLIEHIGSGSYADVFRIQYQKQHEKNSQQKSSSSIIILKLIRLFPKFVLDQLETSNTSRATPYEEAFNEYQILMILSRLNSCVEYRKTIYSCQMFPHLMQGFLVQGSLPQYFHIKQELIDGDESESESNSDDDGEDEEDDYSHEDEEYEYVDKEENSSLMESPSTTKSSSLVSASLESETELRNFQLYQDSLERYQLADSIPIENLMILMEDCGKTICDCLTELKPYACLSIIKQIITGLMIAESVFQFEHRDLHSGNVLLQPYPKKFINYIIRGRRASIPAHGYLVKIIDTTFSRIQIDNKIYFKDLSYLFDDDEKQKYLSEQEMCERQMRRQDIAYQQMSQLVTNNWNYFYPKTNLFWIKYLIYKVKQASSLEFAESCDVDDQYGTTIHDHYQRLQRVNKHQQQQIRRSTANNQNQNNNNSNNPEKQAKQVITILKKYEKLLERCSSCKELFQKIMKDPSLNDCCKISYS